MICPTIHDHLSNGLLSWCTLDSRLISSYSYDEEINPIKWKEKKKGRKGKESKHAMMGKYACNQHLAPPPFIKGNNKINK